MMYIGTSLGGCLRSIMAGEVSEKDVMFIVTRTMAPTFDEYIMVVQRYHTQGNIYSRRSEQYELANFSLAEVANLASRLWNAGKIHQPRINSKDEYGLYKHSKDYSELWLEVMPKYMGDNVSVKDAYEKYKVIRSLVDEGL